MTAAQPPAHRSAPRALALALLMLAIHAGSLAGPLRDGQGGNCAAMFAIMTRNVEHVGWAATRGVPLVNPVPPRPGESLVPYAHHPPGLPWLLAAAARLPLALHTAERLVALALWILSVLLVADLAQRVATPRAGWAAGLALALLPAGVLDGLLVNYESVALPCVLGLTRALLLGRGGVSAWAAAAALTDWIGLAPLALAAAWAPRRRTLTGLVVGGAAAVAALLHGRMLGAGTTAETLGQALAATFLGPDFQWAAWARAWLSGAGTLFGLALPCALLAFIGAPARRRQVLFVLLGVGLLNVSLFAHHASSHEHFWLLFAPFVALALGCLAFPHERRSWVAGLVVLGVLLASSWISAWELPGARQTHRQSDRAQAFAAVSDPRAVHVTPQGVPLVFLEAAARHVLPQPLGAAADARTAAEAYARRFALVEAPRFVFVHDGDAVPDWVAGLGPSQRRGDYRFWSLDD